jgi:hypothetical protein
MGNINTHVMKEIIDCNMLQSALLSGQRGRGAPGSEEHRAQGTEQRTRSPEPGAQCTVHRVKSKEVRSEKPGTRSRVRPAISFNRAGSTGQRAQSTGLRAKSKEQRARSPEQGAEGRELRAKCRELGAKSRVHGAESDRLYAMRTGHRAQSTGRRAKSEEATSACNRRWGEWETWRQRDLATGRLGEREPALAVQCVATRGHPSIRGTGHRAQGTGLRAESQEQRVRSTGHRAEGTGLRAESPPGSRTGLGLNGNGMAQSEDATGRLGDWATGRKSDLTTERLGDWTTERWIDESKICCNENFAPLRLSGEIKFVVASAAEQRNI